MRSTLLAFLLSTAFFSYAQNDIHLWYTQPAKIWTDAIPVGNGRIGAMVFGKYNHEQIQMNEESIWAGSKINNNNKEAAARLPEIQKALFTGEYKKALQLSSDYLVGTPPRIRSYQPLGNIFINYSWKGEPQHYERSLTLNTGIASTEFIINGNHISEDVFASAPDDVMVLNFTASQPVNLEIVLNREIDVNEYKASDNLVYYTGQINDKDDSLTGPGGKHIRFAAAMKVIANNGKTETLISDTAAIVKISSSKSFTILVTGASNYNIENLDMDDNIDALAICSQKIESAAKLSPVVLKQRHIADHRSFFDRVQFKMGSESMNNLPTDERLEKVKAGGFDPGLIVMYYQFGRYLLMGSSRKPGRLPANLQGIWNGQYKAPWNSDFHTNINLQMNYWPAETGNLPETLFPLTNFMEKLMVPGGITAQEMYHAKGWTLHHLTDPFGRTGVADGVWGVSPMAGPWMTFPLYRHFEFTNDTTYLKRDAYPVIKGSVEFVLDFLIKSPEGYLVTNPSHSPENSFFVPGSNRNPRWASRVLRSWWPG